MRYIGRITQLIVVGALVLATAPAAQAGVITYEEVLRDHLNIVPPLDYLRNLERTRTLGDGSAPSFEDDDAAIVADNLVSDSFGIQSADPVTYSHVFLPVSPVEEFQLLSLGIVVGSVSGDPSSEIIPDFIELLLGLGDPNDEVEAEENFLGYLSPTTPFATTTFDFGTGDSALIDLLLDDGRLDITITPVGAGLLLEPDGDRISVRSSTLQVTYDVPEPATLALLAAGLLGAAGARRRRQRRLRRLR